MSAADGLVKSETLAELAKALVEAQKRIKGAKKDSSNPFFKSKYADLESVQDACREPLTDNGLAYVQIPVGDAQLATVLLHSSGEYIGGVMNLNPKQLDPQGVGSAITYGRRYSLSAIAGVAQVDDDGEAAQGRGNREKEQGADDVPTIQIAKGPFWHKDKVLKVKPQKAQGVNELMVQFGEYTCKTSTEPNMSKLLDAEGKEFELQLSTNGTSFIKGKLLYLIHQVGKPEAAKEVVNG